MFSRRRGAVITTLLQDTWHTLMPAAPAGAGSNCRQPLDFMLATLVGNGAAWSVASAGVEEPILEMERAVDEKAVHENPAQTSLSFYKRSALTKLASGRELGFLSYPHRGRTHHHPKISFDPPTDQQAGK